MNQTQPTSDDSFPPKCDFGDGRKAVHTLLVEGQKRYLLVCNDHEKRLANQDKDVRCQYCGVPINNNWRKSALDGYAHVPNCPRSDEEVIQIG